MTSEKDTVRPISEQRQCVKSRCGLASANISKMISTSRTGKVTYTCIGRPTEDAQLE